MTALTIRAEPTDAPVLRRLPVPVAEPRPALRVVREPDLAVAAGQASLDLDLDLPEPGPGPAASPVARPAASPVARPVARPAAGPVARSVQDPGPATGRRRGDEAAVAALCAHRLTPVEALPDPQRWAAQFVQAAVEVAAGQRPAGQLVRWTTEGVHARIARRSQLAARQERAAGPSRARVHSVRVCHPADSIVEACAVVSHRNRIRAVALRLEGLDGRWRVTALEIG